MEFLLKKRARIVEDALHAHFAEKMMTHGGVARVRNLVVMVVPVMELARAINTK